MTQRIFDIENEEDYAELWDILPNNIIKVEVGCGEIILITDDGIHYHIGNFIAIDWHDKTEITRPMQEATKADVDKLCVFWNDLYEEEKDFGLLAEIGGIDKPYRLDNKLADSVDGTELWYDHCRRLTKQEIEKVI